MRVQVESNYSGNKCPTKRQNKVHQSTKQNKKSSGLLCNILVAVEIESVSYHTGDWKRQPSIRKLNQCELVHKDERSRKLGNMFISHAHCLTNYRHT